MIDDDTLKVAVMFLVAKELEKEKLRKGVRRIGGNWYVDAVRRLRRERPAILRALREAG